MIPWAILASFFFLCMHSLILFADWPTVEEGEAEASKERSFVTCHMSPGQLGNQLFVVATTLAFAWDHDMEALFPELHGEVFNLPINRERIFFRLNSSPLPRPIKYTFTHIDNFVKVDIPVNEDQYLFGYFQTWKYFDHHREKIQQIFAPRPEEEIYLKIKYATLLEHPLTVGVHVRTYNRYWGTTMIPFIGLDYYEKALQIFPPETLFVVFSDRINWCAHHFSRFNRQFIFINSQDHIEDLFLMSKLKHNIIGNSSYSWWGAYLNKHPNKIVVVPSHYTHLLSETPYMPDWHIIDIDYDYIFNHYPEDINFYDAHSQSLDTQ